jgi:hypothetical protein
MSKGSKPAGNTTTTQINPTGQAQLPYLQDIWSTAQNLYQTAPQQYYPGQTFSTVGFDERDRALRDLYNSGYSFQQGMLPGINSAFQGALGGGMGVQNSPAYGGYQSFAGGTAVPQQNLQNLQNTALNAGQYYANQAGYYGNAAAQNNNFGLNALMNTAGGAYLNSNPYLDAAIQAAQDPVTRNYQTAVAPQLAGMFSGSGRYGSGAMAGAADTAQQSLARGLGDISSRMSYQSYDAERARQDAAAQQYAGLYNQGLGMGMQGAQAAGNQYQQYLQQAQNAISQLMGSQQYGLTGLQGGYQAGNASTLGALGQAAQIAGLQGTGYGTAANASQTLQQQYQAQIDDAIKRYNAVQYEPWQNLGIYGGMIGAPMSSGQNTTSPYFQNQAANVLGSLTGGLGLARQLGGLGGLGGTGGLFSTGGLLGSQGALFGTLADASIAAGGPPLAAGLTSLAGLEGVPVAAAMAPAAWIICTELMRQGRLSKKHWAAGLKVFDAYPEIAKRGYYAWAIPSVRHLREKPNSRYSRLLGTVFRWRAEDIAARRGVKGARKLWRGRLVTAALALPCLVFGALVGPQDWQSVYS